MIFQKVFTGEFHGEVSNLVDLIACFCSNNFQEPANCSRLLACK